MKVNTLIRIIILASPLILPAGNAFAGDRYERTTWFEARYDSYEENGCEPVRYRYCGIDVDFDKLDARLCCACDELRFGVRYEIEIDDARCCGPFDLVLQLRECGRQVLSESGEPIEFVIPLDCPSDVDDDDIEFKGRFCTNLPRGALYCPWKADVVAIVVDREDGRAIDKGRRSRIRLDD